MTFTNRLLKRFLRTKKCPASMIDQIDIAEGLGSSMTEFNQVEIIEAIERLPAYYQLLAMRNATKMVANRGGFLASKKYTDWILNHMNKPLL